MLPCFGPDGARDKESRSDEKISPAAVRGRSARPLAANTDHLRCVIHVRSDVWCLRAQGERCGVVAK
ncbi:hypothetical protein EVAR_93494_1 [Eumeta japonica]|uniref:Uncharacterized protein n=1 Tax=Eumeta variegata TaxID=151549 RepID=A0A4C1TKP6_EUMVA|nr:hypothetical protein EVAR_93494_1 [Eumeta japonica]